MSETGASVAVAAAPSDIVAAEQAARRFYLDGQSKVEIAAGMGLSRFRVSRLLKLARSAKIVTITIVSPGDIDCELSLAVQDRYQLRDALVVSTPDVADDATVRGLLGATTAELLCTVITRHDVLGLGWARAVLAMVAKLSGLAPCPVVQLSGALTRPDVESDSIEVVRTVARTNGGTAAFFYAPMITATPAAARAIRAETDVAAARAMYDTVTTAVVGVGAWVPPASTLNDALSPAERSAALTEGIFADLSGVLLDQHGRPARSQLSDRIIGITASQLHAIPNVIAIAYGQDKVAATHAAISGGYVNSLVTTASFARSLLQHDPERVADPPGVSGAA